MFDVLRDLYYRLIRLSDEGVIGTFGKKGIVGQCVQADTYTLLSTISIDGR